MSEKPEEKIICAVRWTNSPKACIGCTWSVRGRLSDDVRCIDVEKVLKVLRAEITDE